MKLNSKTSGLARRACSFLSGTALVGCALGLEVFYDDLRLDWLRLVLVLFGTIFIALAFMVKGERLVRAVGQVELALLSGIAAVILAELMVRASGYNFLRPAQPGNEVPIYYRPPSIHMGQGVFRRPGPAFWEGKVLSAFMRFQGWSEVPYADESPVRVEYDAYGFRNPANLLDWDVVVVGDSFVELGYLPEGDLFTSVAARELGARIKNLGVSSTGPIWQTFYLKNYGKAASTREAILCFFEGNDVDDLLRELRSRTHFQAAGSSLTEDFQGSLIRALFTKPTDGFRSLDRRGPPLFTNGWFVGDGRMWPVSGFGRQPPSWEGLGEETRLKVVQAIREWAETARSLGLRPWVLYMPDRRRVLHGLVRPADSAKTEVWSAPGDFLGGLGAACSNLGVQVVNPLPSLPASFKDRRGDLQSDWRRAFDPRWGPNRWEGAGQGSVGAEE